MKPDTVAGLTSGGTGFSVPPLLCRLTACLVMLILAGVASADQTFRVAGIVETASGGKVLIEDGAGEQRWYRPGDAIGEGSVVGIGAKGVTIQVGDDLRLLPLRAGLATLGSLPRQSLREAGGDDAPPAYVTREFAQRYLASRINSFAVDRFQTRDQAAQSALSDTLDLPAGARITAVDREPVTTAGEAADELSRALENSNTVRLSVTGAGPLKVVYVVTRD